LARRGAVPSPVAAGGRFRAPSRPVEEPADPRLSVVVPLEPSPPVVVPLEPPAPRGDPVTVA
jgi:hypothetical protein